MEKLSTTIHQSTAKIPIGIYTSRGHVIQNACVPETQLLFILSGEIDILIEDRTFHLQAEDLCLINEYELHDISAQNGEILTISFNPGILLGLEPDENMYFEINSAGNTQNTAYDYLRYLIAQLVKVNAAGENRYQTLSLFYALTGHMVDNFRTVSNLTEDRKNQQHRMIKITEYIDQNYKDSLTLNALAEQFNLSAPYLSSCFKEYSGVTFMTYYNEVRLSRSVHKMLSSNATLEVIARNNGFRDVRAFVSLFKKKYNCKPSEYRKKHKLAAGKTEPDGTAVPPVNKEAMKNLAGYLNIYETKQDSKLVSGESPINIDAGTVSFLSEGKKLKHTFRTFCCVGSARQFLYSEIQDMVRRAQNEIGYRYVKFHGILSDEMMVYSEDGKGRPVYSFTLINKVLDFLLSVQLKPLLQLSFMPILLASNPNKMIDMWNFNTSPPKDLDKWADLVTAVTKHLIQRYGSEEVRSWLFCVWNEPDGSVASFGWEDTHLFHEFYRRTWCAVKNVDDALLFGSPSLLVTPQEDDSWAGNYFRYCSDYQCPPDFININYYDNSFFSDENSSAKPDVNEVFNAGNLTTAVPLTEDPFAFAKFINQLKKQMVKYDMQTLPIYLTEWNLTVSHRDLINDTCFKSCYLIKNLLQNYDSLDSYGYWCLTDFHEELQLPNQMYHGGLGMLTFNGIPKAHYNSFKFLTQLGSRLIAQGNGYFVTKENSSLTIILYNYEHYSKLFASGILFDMSEENRYAPFTQMKNAHFSIKLRDLPAEDCLIKEMFVNQQKGSSYDAWLKMGAQPLTKAEDMALLSQTSIPGLYLHRQAIENGLLEFETAMAPLEVRLIRIEMEH